jgi:hypothetical protein
VRRQVGWQGRCAPPGAGWGGWWPGVAGAGRSWPEVAGAGRSWPEVAGAGRRWPEPLDPPRRPPTPADAGRRAHARRRAHPVCVSDVVAGLGARGVSVGEWHRVAKSAGSAHPVRILATNGPDRADMHTRCASGVVAGAAQPADASTRPPTPADVHTPAGARRRAQPVCVSDVLAGPARGSERGRVASGRQIGRNCTPGAQIGHERPRSC